MFLVVSQAELDQITADTAAGTGQAGSLGVMYQVRETGLTYVWDPAERAITLAGGLTSSEVSAVRPRQPVLEAASAGADSGWLLVSGSRERLFFQLASGSTLTGFTIDISADGVTSLAQTHTGSWDSSTVALQSAPMMFSDPRATYFKVTITSGGPINVTRGN